jgi:hypothetical protein
MWLMLLSILLPLLLQLLQWLLKPKALQGVNAATRKRLATAVSRCQRIQNAAHAAGLTVAEVNEAETHDV